MEHEPKFRFDRTTVAIDALRALLKKMAAEQLVALVDSSTFMKPIEERLPSPTSGGGRRHSFGSLSRRSGSSRGPQWVQTETGREAENRRNSRIQHHQVLTPPPLSGM